MPPARVDVRDRQALRFDVYHCASDYYHWRSSSEMDANVMISNGLQGGDYSREEELKAFDESKAGTKGLVDAGVNHLPKMFTLPPEEIFGNPNVHFTDLQVPVIDLTGLGNDNDRERIVQEVLYASEKWGFFQVVNHGIPVDVLENMLEGIRRFHEQDAEAKKEYYSRGEMKPVEYNSNYDLYNSKAANWRDTLTVRGCALPDHIDPNLLPPVCRDAILDHTSHVLKLGSVLLELLSLALGLRPDRLNEMDCDKGWACAYHYYPACPQPDLTLGTGKHSDSTFITALLEDQIGGLQVLYENEWIDIQPVPGSLIINIGDLLQMISNGKFKSVLHRVKANHVGPRVSAALFFTGLPTSQLVFGPFKELLSEDNPPLYKDFTIGEFFKHFVSQSHNDTRYERFMIK